MLTDPPLSRAGSLLQVLRWLVGCV